MVSCLEIYETRTLPFPMPTSRSLTALSRVFPLMRSLSIFASSLSNSIAFASLKHQGVIHRSVKLGQITLTYSRNRSSCLSSPQSCRAGQAPAKHLHYQIASVTWSSCQSSYSLLPDLSRSFFYSISLISLFRHSQQLYHSFSCRASKRHPHHLLSHPQLCCSGLFETFNGAYSSVL